MFLPFVLETSQYPFGLCLDEVTLFLRLDGEHPSSGHIIFRLGFPQVDEIKNRVLKPGSVLQMFCFSKLSVVSSFSLSCRFLSAHGISFWRGILVCLRRHCPVLIIDWDVEIWI